MWFRQKKKKEYQFVIVRFNDDVQETYSMDISNIRDGFFIPKKFDHVYFCRQRICSNKFSVIGITEKGDKITARLNKANDKISELITQEMVNEVVRNEIIFDSISLIESLGDVFLD